MFHGELTTEDSRSFIQHPFDVPPNTRAIALRLQYAPDRVAEYDTLITLGLFDPNAFRGQAHRSPPDTQVIVSPTYATPGFVAGAIPAGRWIAEIAVHYVLPTPEPCRYTLSIEFLPAGDERNGRVWQAPIRQIANPSPGWYRGELHAHTCHSDGGLTTSELLALARRRGLDFVTISDHNTISTWGDLSSTAIDGLLVIPSIELTTFRGHAVALGVERYVDWRVGWNGRSIVDAAKATHAVGGLFIIAHPHSQGAPACTGCHWDYIELDPALADAIEAWSGRWDVTDTDNAANLRSWLEAQNGGHTTTAVAVADFHHPENWGAGVPSTFVYADMLSVPAILHGIRHGRVVISSGPWLELSALNAASERIAGIGDTLRTDAASIQLQATWRDAPAGARLRWWRGDDLLAEQNAAGDGTARLGIDVRAHSRLRVELRTRDDALLAMTNPLILET